LEQNAKKLLALEKNVGKKNLIAHMGAGKAMQMPNLPDNGRGE